LEVLRRRKWSCKWKRLKTNKSLRLSPPLKGAEGTCCVPLTAAEQLASRKEK